MQIQLWYCNDMKQWRWTLTDADDVRVQETGQRIYLHDAMEDVARTVEYLMGADNAK